MSTVGVLTVDEAGMPMEKGGRSFVARFVPHSASASTAPFEQPMRDNGDGSYSLHYQLHSTVDHIVTIVDADTNKVVPRTPALIKVVIYIVCTSNRLFFVLD